MIVGALKALESAEHQITLLQKDIRFLQEEAASKMRERNEETKSLLDNQEEVENEMNTCIDCLSHFCHLKMKNLSIPDELFEEVKNIVQSRFPDEDIVSITQKKNLQDATTLFPPIGDTTMRRAISSNSLARSQRRRRIVSEDQSKAQVDEYPSKPLEIELRETRKCLNQMEVELTSTKIRLQQTEAISEQSSAEIARLNDALRQKASVGTGVDSSVQTDFAENIAGEENTNLPSLTPLPNIEKLVAELSTATKAKVDLLKELTKLNKE